MTSQQETDADRRNAKQPNPPTGIAPIARRHSLRGALLVSLAVFLVLWLANVRYRQIYQPSHDDVTALADGLLLQPGAQWQVWFTRGHSDLFDRYPRMALISRASNVASVHSHNRRQKICGGYIRCDSSYTPPVTCVVRPGVNCTYMTDAVAGFFRHPGAGVVI